MTKASDLGKWAIGINSLPANIIRTIGVGIGTTNPTVMLDVSECIKASQLNVSGISTVSTLVSPSLVAGVNITSGGLNVAGVTTISKMVNADKGLTVTAGSSLQEVNISGLSTFSGTSEILVGAAITIGRTGVSTFVSDLHVGGSQAAGVVLTSPDGTRYRLVVANGGALSTSAV